MAVDWSAIVASYETAILAVADAIASGAPVAEYEINGRRVRREATPALLKELRTGLAELAPAAAAQTRGSTFSLGEYRG